MIKSQYLSLHGNRFLICALMLVSALTVWARNAVPHSRVEITLSGDGWRVWRDTEAQWRNDRLYLPSEITDLTQLPVNAPTGGWGRLTPVLGDATRVPGTVEDLYTTSAQPQPDDLTGVSWWWRKIKVPATEQGRRFLLHFEAVRQRAEVYLDGRLVAYDLISETPFDADLTQYVRPGKVQMLAVRITNPGGNFHWQDYTPMYWGKYQMPPGRSFGGILGQVVLRSLGGVSISDVYMQNQPTPTQVKAIVTIDNREQKPWKGNLLVEVVEKNNPNHVVASQVLPSQLAVGESVKEVTIDYPQAKLWDLGQPNLYVARVSLVQKKACVDKTSQTFGFRWFSPTGVGRDAVLRLNGRRVMLRTAIAWGFWPQTGLIATQEMAEKQVKAAQTLGLNMLNFHRNIGQPRVLNVADSLGLLYYEEPGGFHAPDHNEFGRAIAREKLLRMVKRDRSHPSLVIYTLVNEWGGLKARDEELTQKRFKDMQDAHAVDPSRQMNFTSGWAGKEDADEHAKANLRPFDMKLYERGWWDNHRAGGPATWEEGYYKSPTNQFMYSDNKTEIVMRGEEGALSIPPRLAKIHESLQQSGHKGWDGAFWEKQYNMYNDFFQQKGLAKNFSSLDEFTLSLGDVQLRHQGLRLQGMRMQNVGDVYAINGWESMPYDNHSGVVDIYRNIKGHTETFERYARPLYVAVAPRQRFVKVGGKAAVDLYVVNEKDLQGQFRLVVEAQTLDGKVLDTTEKTVSVKGGDTFGELLAENVQLAIGSEPGLYNIVARLVKTDGTIAADGHEDVLATALDAAMLRGKGAIYGTDNDPVARFYKEATGKELPAFGKKTGKLDWLVVTRPSLDAPTVIPAECFQRADGTPGLDVKVFSDGDIARLAGTSSTKNIDEHYADGAQPHELLPANQHFSMIWTGKLIAPKDGTYMIGIQGDRGMRLSVNGARLIDVWRNLDERTQMLPFTLKKGEVLDIEVQYSQVKPTGHVALVWSEPGKSQIAPDEVLERAQRDGTAIILLQNTESWMPDVSKATRCDYKGFYVVGKNWVGGVHFGRQHPFLNGLPQDQALDWPYELLVYDGDRRLGFNLQGEDDMAVGSMATWPANIGSALGVIPCGKGSVVYNTLNIADNLRSERLAADVARRIFCNIVDWAVKK